MPLYVVNYVDSTRRSSSARIEAADAQSVARQLGVAPWALLSVEPAAPPEAAPPTRHSLRRFPLRQFAQQLGVLLRAGIPLLEALVTLKQKEEAGSEVTRALAGVIERIELGEPFSHALRSQPQAFDALFVAVVESSERSGLLDRALGEQAEYLAWVDQLRAKLVAAAIYPATLLAAGSAVILFLLVFVVPRFAGMLDGVSANAELPLASRALVAVGGFCGAHPYAVLIGAALLAAAPMLAWKRGLRDALTARLWRLPLLGPKLHLLALAQFYRSLAMLLMAGVPLVPALMTARGVIAAHLRPALDRCTDAVRVGERLSQALEREGLSTPVSLRMLSVGERGGEMGPMLAQAAAFYDEELTRLSELVTRLINPLLMLLMGGVIGTVVVLMYMPIFQLVEQVQ